MRVISGKFGSRRIESPKGKEVRPTHDKVKGAIFNILNNYIDWDEVVMLDAFCGTGNLGIEAISRGAEFVTFIDISRESVYITKENLSRFGIENAEVFCGDVMNMKLPNKKYNLVMLDPPYSQNLYLKALEHMQKEDILAQDFIAVLEMDAKNKIAIPESYEVLQERVYGKVKLMVLKQNKP